MTAEEFKETTSKELESFCKWWEANRESMTSMKEFFPENMSQGDWFEQFLFFIETKKS